MIQRFCQLLLLFLTSVSTYAQRTSEQFDTNWKFLKGDIASAEAISFNDAAWRNIDLPHDWSIEDLPNQSDSVIGPFTKASIGTTATAYTVGGNGWYRKHFRLSNLKNEIVSIYFDGVYMNSDVWVNGRHIGNHAYGYTPFYYDITSFIKQNADNIIAVRVKNEGKNSRWYSGSGIYRHVWLTRTKPVHIEPWGVFITTPNVSKNIATVNIKTAFVIDENHSPLAITTTITNAKNRVVGIVTSPVGSERKLAQNLIIKNPQLWSPQTPHLYRAVTEIRNGKQVIDRVETSFGIRSLKFSAAQGFQLNGENLELRGGCMHHDNGPLGSAAIDRAEERRVELLKKNGFNAVRTSHNPPSQSFLDACDRLGMIVIDEGFDMWQRPKNPQDYHLYFDANWQQDLDAMVLRDRNHPSVVFWSIGNEINERVDSSGLAIAKRLIDEVKRLDTTRPVTNALCSFYDHAGYKWDTTAPAFALQDVGSYNYMTKEYEADHAKYPDRIVMGTEAYAKDALRNWNLVEKLPYVIGDFVWTAMDHLGETGLGNSRIDSGNRRGGLLKPFPWFNSWAGDIDLIGDKKPQLYFRDVVWRTKPMHLLVHTPIPAGMKETVSDWGWPDELPYYYFPGSESKRIQVKVYTRYPEVKLMLNGKIIEQKSVTLDNLTAAFEIDYQPGVLKAVAVSNGKEVDSVVLQTPGKPVKIRLSADRRQLKSTRNDLSYVTVEVLDEAGRLVPESSVPIKFTIAGKGEIAATASAGPNDMQSFQKPEHRTFRGKCLVIVRPTGLPGNITLQATSEGLASGNILIDVK